MLRADRGRAQGRLSHGAREPAKEQGRRGDPADRQRAAAERGQGSAPVGRARERGRGQRRSRRRDGLLQHDRARRRSVPTSRKASRRRAASSARASARRCSLRRVPELRFRHDTSARRGVEIGRLIDEAGAAIAPRRLSLERAVSATTARGRDVRGILLLDKPRGITSNRALQRVKRLYGAAKAGHTGSLDPLATGMLPICFGAATRLGGLPARRAARPIASRRVSASRPTPATPTARSRERRDAAAADRGRAARGARAVRRRDIEQVPPMYSALKHDGVRALPARPQRRRRAARAAPRARSASSRSSATTWPDAELFVRCSKGTYVRTLVEDIAAALGTVGARRRAAAARRGAVRRRADDDARGARGARSLRRRERARRATAAGRSRARRVGRGRCYPARPLTGSRTARRSRRIRLGRIGPGQGLSRAGRASSAIGDVTRGSAVGAAASLRALSAWSGIECFGRMPGFVE